MKALLIFAAIAIVLYAMLNRNSSNGPSAAPAVGAPTPSPVIADSALRGAQTGIVQAQQQHIPATAPSSAGLGSTLGSFPADAYAASLGESAGIAEAKSLASGGSPLAGPAAVAAAFPAFVTSNLLNIYLAPGPPNPTDPKYQAGGGGNYQCDLNAWYAAQPGVVRGAFYVDANGCTQRTITFDPCGTKPAAPFNPFGSTSRYDRPGPGAAAAYNLEYTNYQKQLATWQACRTSKGLPF